jgi:hypothetical protein
MQPALLQLQERLQQLHAEFLVSHAVDAPLSMQADHWGLIVAYMDDCTIGCHRLIANELCAELEAIFGPAGLQLNRNKCKIIGPAILDNPPFEQLFAGDIVLGSPVGTWNYRHATCLEIARQQAKILPALAALPINTRSTFAIIRLSTNAGLTFLVRAADDASADAARLFDGLIDDAVRSMARQRPSNVAHRRRLTATLRSLPLHLGGLGIHRHSWLFGQMGMIKARVKMDDFLLDFCPHLRAASHAHLSPIHLGAFDPLNHLDPMDSPLILPASEDVDWGLVQDTARAQFESVASRTLEHVLQHHGSSHAAWLRSSQFDGSGRFLLALDDLSTPLHLRMSEDEYHTSLRMRLLLGPNEDISPHNRPVGYCSCPLRHLLDCGHDAFYTHRHTAAVQVLHRFLKKHLPVATFTLEPHFS